MFGADSDRWLWISFLVLFGVVAIAAVSPVEPIVGVFPFWSLLVLVACLVAVLVGVVAVRTGWPREVSES